MEEIKIILNDNLKFIIIAFVAFGLDFITGFSRALLQKNVQSSKLKKSIFKLIVYFAFVVMGACLELLFPTDKTFKIQIVCLAIIATDFYSVYENSKDILNIPFIAEYLKQFKDKNTK
ncbi:MAG: phage holin family protein [Eubacterium sp.]|jgi:phage-related holin